MRDTNKFHFFCIFSKLFYYCFLYHGDQKIAWWRICRWQAVNFDIHLCSSGVNSDLGECLFWGLCKSVVASTDLWPQKMFTFFENTYKWSLACVGLSESSFSAIQEGVCVCHARPTELHAHVPLVRYHHGHFKALRRCRLVGCSVRPGENFFTDSTFATFTNASSNA